MTSITWGMLLGSPGPLDSMIPSGERVRTRFAVKSCGTTVTAQPRLSSSRRIECLRPKSKRTTLYLPKGLGYAVRVDTWLIWSVGSCRARKPSSAAPRSASGPSSVPFMTPWSRNRRTRARVSIPARPGMSWARRNSSRFIWLRQLEATRGTSRHTTPAVVGNNDSMSSRLMPVLPMSG